MRRLLPLLAMGAFLSALPSPVDAASYRLSNLNGGRQITFYSRTNLEGFEGNVTEFSGTARFDPDKDDLGLSGSLTLPVMSMKTGITLRDVHMRGRDWLNENRYPTIRFETTGPPTRVKRKGTEKWFATVPGLITIKGRSKAIAVPLTVKTRTGKKGDEIHLHGSFKVKLKDHGIFGPMAMKMVGAKVSEEIEISLRLVGRKAGN